MVVDDISIDQSVPGFSFFLCGLFHGMGNGFVLFLRGASSIFADLLNFARLSISFGLKFRFPPNVPAHPAAASCCPFGFLSGFLGGFFGCAALVFTASDSLQLALFSNGLNAVFGIANHSLRLIALAQVPPSLFRLSLNQASAAILVLHATKTFGGNFFCFPYPAACNFLSSRSFGGLAFLGPVALNPGGQSGLFGFHGSSAFRVRHASFFKG